MKIGYFGGTFNPIHLAHIHMAETYIHTLGLDKMILMPTYLPPHKSTEHLADAEERITMCRLAVEGNETFSICDFEVRQKGKSYTYRTLRHLCEQYPDSSLYMIMGGDMFLTVQNWEYAEDIFRLATLCTAEREPGELAKLRVHRENLEKLGARCIITDMPAIPLSSTLIRRKLFAGEDVSELLHPSVCRYIRERGLYRE